MAQKAEVNFQPRVWFDIPITLWLIEDVLVPYITTIRGSPEEWVIPIVHGNGKVYCSQTVKECCDQHHILACHSEPNVSHMCSVIDRSVGKTLKDLANSALDD